MRLEHAERVQPHRRRRARAPDEPVDPSVGVHDRRVARVGGGRTLGAHDRRHHERAALRCELGRGLLELGTDHAGGSGRPCMAAHTRAGEQGMSMCARP